MTDRNISHEEASIRYRFAFGDSDRLAVPCYAALADALSVDDTACTLLEEFPPAQWNPMVVFAALHEEALMGHEVLRPLYARLGTAESPTPQDFAQRVRDVVRQEPQIIRSRLSRATQTNEINRSAVLMGVLSKLRRRGLTECSLIDLGCSMGLNLYPDFQTVAPDDDGPPASLACEMHGEWQHFGPLPQIYERVGVDQQPLDPRRDDDARWLRACLWPEQRRRLQRLNAALAASGRWPEAHRLQGDVTDMLDAALALCRPEAPVVIMHTWMAGYLSLESQQELARQIRQHAVTRDIVWVAFEHPQMIPGLNPPRDVPVGDASTTVLLVAPDGNELEFWGTCHPHGRWADISA